MAKSTIGGRSSERRRFSRSPMGATPSEEVSARVTQIASRARQNPGSIKPDEIQTLADSVLGQSRDQQRQPRKAKRHREKQQGQEAQRKGASKRSSASLEVGDFMVARRYLSVDGLVDVDAVTAEFGMTKAALAQSLGFAEETLQRFSRVAAPKTQQRLREMLEILSRVESWAGGFHQAMGWYRGQSIAALGDQTAEALVKNDQASLVRAYLDGVAVGSYA